MTNLMKKFLLIIGFVFAILFTSSTVFAADNVGNAIQDAGNGIRNVVGGAENVVENGVNGFGNAVKDGIDNIGNTMNFGNNNSTTNNNNFMKSNNSSAGLTGNTNGYTATRTTTDGNSSGMASTAWTWIILAIAAVLIIGLVWYYAAQTNSRTDYDNK